MDKGNKEEHLFFYLKSGRLDSLVVYAPVWHSVDLRIDPCQVATRDFSK